MAFLLDKLLLPIPGLGAVENCRFFVFPQTLYLCVLSSLKNKGAIPKNSNIEKTRKETNHDDPLHDTLHNNDLVKKEIENTWELGKPSPKESTYWVIFAESARLVALPEETKRNQPSKSAIKRLINNAKDNVSRQIGGRVAHIYSIHKAICSN